MVGLSINTYGKLGLATVLGLSTLTLGACSTTSGAHSEGAPITYKVDQASVRQTSVTQPYTGLLNSPQQSKPAPRALSPVQKPNYRVSPSIPMPAPTLPKVSEFDPKTVDTVLYKHQRVGKTYKIMGKKYTPKHQPNYDVTGTASWYGDKFHGKPTATGELFDMDDITAAHKTLPLNSMVYVTNLATGQGLMVRVNDRGPFIGDRIIDLSRATARRLGYFTSGLAQVRVQYAGPADPMAVKKNKLPIARPSTPELLNAPNPDLVARAPKIETPKYEPLRDLGTPPATQTALPKLDQAPRLPFQPRQYVNPLLEFSDKSAETAPVSPAPAAPSQSVLVPKKDTQKGPITLTIKGPIHMAKSKNTDEKTQAKFIPAVNYVNRAARAQ